MIWEFHEEARAELEAAAKYYEKEVPNLGYAFVSEVRQATLLIGENPHVGQSIDGQIRQLVLRRFPFCLMYVILAEKLIVLAVAHQRRRPGYWRSRIIR